MPEETGLTGCGRCSAQRGANRSNVVKAHYQVYIRGRTMYHDQNGGNTVNAEGYIEGLPTGPRIVSENLINDIYTNRKMEDVMRLATTMFGSVPKDLQNPSDLAIIQC